MAASVRSNCHLRYGDSLQPRLAQVGLPTLVQREVLGPQYGSQNKMRADSQDLGSFAARVLFSTKLGIGDCKKKVSNQITRLHRYVSLE
jgi:hypothetical protein